MNLPVRGDRYSVVPAAQAKERGGVLSFFSSQERKGAWDLPRQLRVACCMGSVELDLREARIPEGESVIEVIALFGSVEILMPPGVEVELDGDALAGSFTFQPDPSLPAREGAPRIRLRGGAYFASVECEARLPGESKGAANRRLKAARR